MSSDSIKENIDSLHQQLNTVQDDSTKIKTYHFLGHYYSMMDSLKGIDSAIYYLETSIELMEESEMESMSSYPYVKLIKLHKKLSNHDEALACALHYLSIGQKNNDIAWQAKAYGDVLELFDFMKDSVRAYEYVDKLENLLPKIKSEKVRSETFNTLGTFYKNHKENTLALKFHKKALDIRIKNDWEESASYSYNNIALVYRNMKDYDKALDFLQKSLVIKEALDLTKGMAGSNINIAKIYLIKKDYKKGKNYVEKGIDLAKKAKAHDFLSVGWEVKYELEKNTQNYREALHALEEYNKTQQIILDQEKIKNALEFERKYEAEKQKQKNIILQKESDIKALEIQKKEARLSQQRFIIIVFSIAFIIIAALVIFLIKTGNEKQKINKDLEHANVLLQEKQEETELQKEQLEVKNKEITDSIAYAKRIQNAILPSKEYMDQHLEDYFVLYKPKDIVAGDFYWFEKVGNTLYVAAADCTGHGVPGAMVSVVCANMLNKVLQEEKVTTTNKILDRTRTLVVDYFEKADDEVNDGMDIALLAIHYKDTEPYKVSFSGANNNLFHIQSKAESVQDIISYKGDKQPVGKYEDSFPFSHQKIEIAKGDLLYIFTDGYPDQFGGNEGKAGGKKLKTNNFKKLIHSYHQFLMEEQKELLDKAFEKWRGDLEQVDDICIIGIRL